MAQAGISVGQKYIGKALDISVMPEHPHDSAGPFNQKAVGAVKIEAFYTDTEGFVDIIKTDGGDVQADRFLSRLSQGKLAVLEDAPAQDADDTPMNYIATRKGAIHNPGYAFGLWGRLPGMAEIKNINNINSLATAKKVVTAASRTHTLYRIIPISILCTGLAAARCGRDLPFTVTWLLMAGAADVEPAKMACGIVNTATTIILIVFNVLVIRGERNFPTFGSTGNNHAALFHGYPAPSGGRRIPGRSAEAIAGILVGKGGASPGKISEAPSNKRRKPPSEKN